MLRPSSNALRLTTTNHSQLLNGAKLPSCLVRSRVLHGFRCCQLDRKAHSLCNSTWSTFCLTISCPLQNSRCRRSSKAGLLGRRRWRKMRKTSAEWCMKRQIWIDPSMRPNNSSNRVHLCYLSLRFLTAVTQYHRASSRKRLYSLRSTCARTSCNLKPTQILVSLWLCPTNGCSLVSSRSPTPPQPMDTPYTWMVFPSQA